MLPTVLDALGIEAPDAVRGVTQSPIHGVSFAHTFDDAAAATRHHTQYFEMFGHRAIDHDGWRAVCRWPGPSFAEAGKPFGARWYVEAGKYNVLPVYGSTIERLIVERPQIAKARTSYTFRPGTQTVPAAVGPIPRSGHPRWRRRRGVLSQGTGVWGRAQLYVDGRLVGQAEFPVTTLVAFNPGGLTCGANSGLPITPDYRAPFRFTGTLHSVTVDLSGDLTDSAGEMRLAMSRQ